MDLSRPAGPDDDAGHHAGQPPPSTTATASSSQAARSSTMQGALPGKPRSVELTVEQLKELRAALERPDPSAVMMQLGLTPQSEPFAKDPSVGMSPPHGLPPPDDYDRIWLRCGHGQDEHWDISILEHARAGGLPSLPRLESWSAGA